MLISPTSKNQKICIIERTKKYCFVKLRFPGVRSHWRMGSQFEELLVRTNASQSWNHGRPVRGTAGPKVRINASQSSNHGFPVLLYELAVPKRWNQCFPILEPRPPSSRNCWLPKVQINASQSWNHGFPVLL